MQKGINNKIVSWLLVMAVALGPMQAAVSAIDMLDHSNAPTNHCQMGMADHLEQQDDSGHGDCCQDGVGCVKCISVNAMIPYPTILTHINPDKFYSGFNSHALGITGQSELRPPRSFS